MRRIFHRCVPEWDLCDLYIFTGLDMCDLHDLYEMQGLYDLAEWNLCDLDDLHILTGMRYARFAGSERSAGFLYDELEDL